MENLYGLIGYPLSHSFSKKYFTQKFAQENIPDARYELFELKEIQQLRSLLQQQPQLRGLNVTIPYKQQVITFLDTLDANAQQIGAVNTIRIHPETKQLAGFNTDYYGFKTSLEKWVGNFQGIKALVLGTGGASKAVQCALEHLEIPYRMVSRNATETTVAYEQLKSVYTLADYRLLINTTPLGMSPRTETYPDLLYEQLTSQHFCYDLVYNPEQTKFMTLAAAQGAQVKNGLEMLYLQAEKSWEIWHQ